MPEHDRGHEAAELSVVLTEGGASRRGFDRSDAHCERRPRVGYDRRLSSRTIAFRSVSPLVVSAVLLGLFLPAADPLRSSLYYGTEGLFRSTYVEVP